MGRRMQREDESDGNTAKGCRQTSKWEMKCRDDVGGPMWAATGTD